MFYLWYGAGGRPTTHVSFCPASQASRGKGTLVVRFRHLLPLAARLKANAGIIRTTSNYMFLVKLLNLTFEIERDTAGTRMSNSLH